jgi:hypothetical protein
MLHGNIGLYETVYKNCSRKVIDQGDTYKLRVTGHRRTHLAVNSHSRMDISHFDVIRRGMVLMLFDKFRQKL